MPQCVNEWSHQCRHIGHEIRGRLRKGFLEQDKMADCLRAIVEATCVVRVR